MLRPSPGWDMVDSTATVLVWAMVAMAMAAFMATDSQPMADMDMVDTATERGLLMLRPMPGMDMVVSMAMDSQLMVVMAMDCGERSKPRLPKTSTDHHMQ